jgi:hypothetical protein
VASRVASLRTLVNVHCRSRNSFDRWEQKMQNDPLCGEARLMKLIPVVEQLNSDLHNPLDFGCPSIVVNTDDGYQPALEAIIAQIDTLYSRPTIHDLDSASYVSE